MSRSRSCPTRSPATPTARAVHTRSQALAALNHPNIAHIHGFEDSGGVRAIVMELVEGEDLAQRIARGPMRVADVILIARQIVDAVGAAHDKGIIHRDLKPANITVTQDGTVKVLDFGLAKTLGTEADAGSAATITSAGTVQGVVLGTAAYMSPEQARGQAVDARSDVWAFGCVLFEMLAGRRAFPGATTSDTIARILEREPDWAALAASMPPSLRRLLTRCLEKDPKRRLHAIADARFEIDEALVESKPGAGTPAARVQPRIGRWAIAASVVALILSVGAWKLWPTRKENLQAAYVKALTSYPGSEVTPSFSPDGKQVAFSWDGEKQDNEDIYVAILGSDSHLRLTQDAARDVSPAWKPDGSQIAFARLAAGRAAIYVVSPLGASEQKLAEFSAVPLTGAPIGSDDPMLSWSPDGRWLAVSRVRSGAERGVFVMAEDGSSRRLLLPAKPDEDYYAATFSPTGDSLAYVNSGHIEVVGIGPAGEIFTTAPARRLTSSLGSVNGLTWTIDGKELVFGQSADPSKPSHLWRLSVPGGARERIDLAGVAAFPAVSLSGNRLAYSRRDLNVDLLKLQEGRDPEVMFASSFNEHDASFSPDDSKVAFSSDRTGEGMEIWVANAADGSGRRSVSRDAYKPAGSPRWSPDGRRIAFDGVGDDGKYHVYVVDETGGPIQPLAHKAGFSDVNPSWSRDGKWIYFGSNRTGRAAVWRAPSDGGDAQQVTTFGSTNPEGAPPGLFCRSNHRTAARCTSRAPPREHGSCSRCP